MSPRLRHGLFAVWAARVGLLAAAVCVGVGWWVTAHGPDAVLAVASLLATVGLVVGLLGYRTQRDAVLVGGVVLAGIAAPTGFAYPGNLVAVVAGVVLAASLIGTRRSRRRAAP